MSGKSQIAAFSTIPRASGSSGTRSELDGPRCGNFCNCQSLTERKLGRWIFLGYIGAGNAGDDLMAASLMKHLDPAVLSRSVFLGRSDTRPSFLEGIPVRYDRATAKASLKHILRAEGLVLLGGTNYHDAVSDSEWPVFRRKLLFLTALFGLCRLVGCKTIFLGVGVGPLSRRDARRIASVALKLGSLVVLRDRNSLELAQALGVRRPHDGCDLAFLSMHLLPFIEGRETRILGVAPTTLGNLVGVLPEIDCKFWDHLCERIARNATTNNIAKVKIFAFNVSGGLSDDRQLCIDIQRRLSGHGVETELILYGGAPDAILRSIQECQWFMAFRYHSAIMAALLRKRIILVPYHRKVSDLVGQLGVELADVLNAQQKTKDALNAEIDRVIGRLDSVGRPAADPNTIIAQMDRVLSLASEVGVPILGRSR